jgi:uncharacterized protein YbbK (DUF523 family)
MSHAASKPSPPKLLVSACLLGNPVRYDGEAKTIDHAGLQRLLEEDRIVPFCPEVAGGLPVPRAPAEIIGGDGNAVLDGRARVATRAGDDVSDSFVEGARQALALCRQHYIAAAVLTERSPSCGSGEIYDGSFTRQRIDGSGVTAALLRRHGIAVFGHSQLNAALHYLQKKSQPAGITFS